jgi:hypothetical protein
MAGRGQKIDVHVLKYSLSKEKYSFPWSSREFPGNYAVFPGISRFPGIRKSWEI